jgi:hypothetical protein
MGIARSVAAAMAHLHSLGWARAPLVTVLPCGPLIGDLPRARVQPRPLPRLAQELQRAGTAPRPAVPSVPAHGRPARQLDAALRVRIGDVGIARLRAYVELLLMQRFCTVESAPEVLLGHGAAARTNAHTPPHSTSVPARLTFCLSALAGAETSQAADVYGLGIIMWELVMRRSPFADLSVDELQERLRAGTAALPPLSVTDGEMPVSTAYAEVGRAAIPLRSLSLMARAVHHAVLVVRPASAAHDGRGVYRAGQAVREPASCCAALLLSMCNILPSGKLL